MYEEFLRQAQEFSQSIWGGLFYLVGGVLIVALSLHDIRRERLWLAIIGLLAALSWTIMFFLEGRLLFGSLLALIVLVSVAYAIIMGVQRRRRKT
jgi:hypothetical protein